jgi:3-oxosteroid 1-dehydrogenase
MAEEWDYTTDVVVVGSGGGLVAALVAADEGLEALVIEKQERVGGSTAMSGGVAWIPNNPVILAGGVDDSYEDGMRYFDAVVGDVGPASSRERRHAYLTEGPAMVSFLSGTAIHTGEVAAISTPHRSLRHLLVAARVFARNAKAKLTGQYLLSNGAALVAFLLDAAVRKEIPIWTETACRDLVVEDGAVVGVVAERKGKALRIRARRGVLLAAGGFARNAEMRRKYSGDQPNDARWTTANPGDTGEVIEAAMRLGAAADLMDEAWWSQSAVLPDGTPLMHIAERTRPHSIMVDSKGQRFVNEAASYMEVGRAQYERDRSVPALPCWLVADARHRRLYPWGLAPPMRTPKEWIETGFMKKARSLRELAEQCGIDADEFVKTVERFNEYATRGEDPDFQRGASAYDRYYGDPAHKPNPSLGTLEKAPFYAVAIYPGDVGTCGGLLTDEHARVLRGDGTLIAGLYATGNTTATVMGRRYLGAGASIGASLIFAYIAARDMARVGTA